jgi:hypothetical protein
MAVVSTYATLVTAVGDYLARSDLTTFIPNFIQNFEERFYRQPRNWGAWMETAFSGAIASSVVAVPSDFLAWKVVSLGGQSGRKLQQIPLSKLHEDYPRGGSSGKPKYIARNASNFEFGPIPDSAYTVTGTYYAKQTVIRTDSDGINWLVTNAPDLLIYGALLEAEPFLKNDSRVALWQGFHDRALQDYRDFIKATDLSGGPLQTQIG